MQSFHGLRVQGEDVDVFDRVTVGTVFPVHTSPSLGRPQPYPVGRPVAGTTEPGPIHQGLQHKGTITISSFPVSGQMLSTHREYLAGQAVDCNPGENQKTAVVDYILEILPALRIAPVDPVVSGGHLPCGAGKKQAGQRLVRSLLGEHHVAHISPKWDPVAQIMVAFNILGPHTITGMIIGSNPVEDQGCPLSHTPRQRRLGIALSGDLNSGGIMRSSVPQGGQADQTLVLQSLQEEATFMRLQTPIRPLPLQQLADRLSQLVDRQSRKIMGNLTDGPNVGCGERPARKGYFFGKGLRHVPLLSGHNSNIPKAEGFVQQKSKLPENLC